MLVIPPTVISRFSFSFPYLCIEDHVYITRERDHLLQRIVIFLSKNICLMNSSISHEFSLSLILEGSQNLRLDQKHF